MAINEENGGQRGQQQNVMSEAFERAHQSNKGTTNMTQDNTTQGQAQPHGLNRKFSLRTMGRLQQTMISRQPISELLSELEKRLAEEYEQYSSKLNIKLIALDVNAIPEIPQSLLVVAERLRDEKSKKVAFHTFILFGTGGELPPRYENHGTSQIMVRRLPTDVWEPRLKAFVAGWVARQFDVDVRDTIEMDGTVIMPDFDIKNDTQVKLLAANALIATNTELEQFQTNFADINLKDVQDDAQLQTRVLFNDEPVMSPTGRPIRADIIVKMTATGLPNQGMASDRVTEVAQLTGYVDVSWAGPSTPQGSFPGFQQDQGGFNPWGAQQQQQVVQPYLANLVITSMETNQLQTPAAQLLALLQAAVLFQNNLWTHALRPRAPKKGDPAIDLNDIGALGYESPFERDPQTGAGLRLDTKSANFSDELFAFALTKWLQPGLEVSLDIPDAGYDAWFNGPFAAAAQGSQVAKKVLLQAANTLTNGEFGPLYAQFGGTGEVISDRNNRIIMGWYLDPNGKMRDLRDYGYIAVANMRGDKSPQDLAVYSNSMQDKDLDINVRLADRFRLLDGMVQAHYEGWATRGTFEAAFFRALAAGAHRSGLSMRPNVNVADYGRAERATQQYAGSVLSGQVTGGLFTGGYGQPQQIDGTRAYRASTRWGGV